MLPAPDPTWIASYYTDDCGEVSAELINSWTGGTACGGFSVNRVYRVSDECGNYVDCTVTHSGGNDIPLTGFCPEGSVKLECIEDVPEADPSGIAAGYSGAGIVTAELINTITDGDNCGGFTVTYVYEISDDCDTENL